MKKLTLFLFVISMSILSTKAQQVIKLWENNPPTSNEITTPEKVEKGRVSNVSDPEIIVYLPDQSINKKMAVIICPGGGYSILAIDHEGHQFAQWLTKQGIAGIVLKYRMPNQKKEIPLDDFQQAIRYVRSQSAKWDIDTNKIGVSGFSAGGHLASTASTHFMSKDVRPDFSILFYPVITMEEFTHGGSRLNLLGKTPSEKIIQDYSNDKRVSADTPPAILLLSDDDKAVVPQNSISYYQALKKNNIPATMYIFPSGGHGWGMNETFKYHNQMLTLLKMWLEQQDLASSSNK